MLPTGTGKLAGDNRDYTAQNLADHPCCVQFQSFAASPWEEKHRSRLAVVHNDPTVEVS